MVSSARRGSMPFWDSLCIPYRVYFCVMICGKFVDSSFLNSATIGLQFTNPLWSGYCCIRPHDARHCRIRRTSIVCRGGNAWREYAPIDACRRGLGSAVPTRDTTRLVGAKVHQEGEVGLFCDSRSGRENLLSGWVNTIQTKCVHLLRAKLVCSRH